MYHREKNGRRHLCLHAHLKCFGLAHIPTAITSNVLRDERNRLTLTQNSTNWFPLTNYYRAGTKLYNTNIFRNRSFYHPDYLCLAECIKKYVICLLQFDKKKVHAHWHCVRISWLIAMSFFSSQQFYVAPRY